MLGTKGLRGIRRGDELLSVNGKCQFQLMCQESFCFFLGVWIFYIGELLLQDCCGNSSQSKMQTLESVGASQGGTAIASIPEGRCSAPFGRELWWGGQKLAWQDVCKDVWSHDSYIFYVSKLHVGNKMCSLWGCFLFFCLAIIHIIYSFKQELYLYFLDMSP